MISEVLMDVDGLIANFIKLYLDALLEATGMHRKPEEITTWDTGDALGLTKTQRAAVHSRLVLPGRAFSMEVYPDAVDAVKELSTFTDLYFVTSPFPAPTWVYDREQWLQLHFGDLGKKVIHTKHKHKVQGHYLIDDKIDNILSWQDSQPGVGILWDTPYNQEANLFRMKNWNDLVKFIREKKIP